MDDMWRSVSRSRSIRSPGAELLRTHSELYFTVEGEAQTAKPRTEPSYPEMLGRTAAELATRETWHVVAVKRVA